MSCQLEPAIWSRDTGQRIPCFGRCQLIMTWMSNTKEVHSKPRLHVSLLTCYLEYGSHLARLHRRAAGIPLLICRNNSKNAWEKSNDAYSLSIRVHTMKTHISICFFTNVTTQNQRQRKCFSRAQAEKGIA